MNGWRDLAARALGGEGVPTSPDVDEAPFSAGLERLRAMRMPRDAKPERWAQIVADASRLVASWGPRLEELGWTGEDLFGLDPLAEDRDDIGLVFAIKGERVVLVDERSAAIRKGKCWRLHYRRANPPALIWEAPPTR